MKTMTKDQALVYASGLKFGVRDFEKLKSKYENYRKNINLTFEGDTWEGGQLVQYEDNLARYIDDKLYGYGYEADLYKKMEQGELTKSNIRQFKTCINQLTYKMNKNFIERYHDNLNLPKNHRFTERYYVLYYQKINEAMKSVLLELINRVDD